MVRGLENTVASLAINCLAISLYHEAADPAGKARDLQNLNGHALAFEDICSIS